LPPEEADQFVHNLRDVFDGSQWLVRSGALWRCFPKDFPRWEMVYQQSRSWLAAECLGRE
jgi:transposase